MLKLNYVFYEKTNPFPGWIRMVGHVDIEQIPDGSTIAERLEQLLIKYPDSDYKLFPWGTLPDPESQKFHIATETICGLEPGDITPKAQKELDKSQRAQDIIDNLPSWAQVRTAIINAFPDPAQQNVMLKTVRIVYWLAKNEKD